MPEIIITKRLKFAAALIFIGCYLVAGTLAKKPNADILRTFPDGDHSLMCDDGDPCTIDVVNPHHVGHKDKCIHYAKNCGDDNECTDDSCVDGVCQHVDHVCPDPDPDTCTRYECFVGDGLCYPHVVPDCLSPTLRNACMTAVCVEGEMEIREISCDDGNPCTADACTSPIGMCSHSIVDCADATLLTYDFCDNSTGECMHVQSDCRASDMCHWSRLGPEQVCITGPIDCNDGNPCTLDSCRPNTGCIHLERDCSNRNPCMIGVCDPSVEGGRCVSVPMICDDGNPCTQDRCDDGECVHKLDECDECKQRRRRDGKHNEEEEEEDRCVRRMCNNVTGQCVDLDLQCNDNDACTIDSCHPKSGCIHMPLPNLGIDEKECVVRICDHITGEITTVPRDCDDDNACTIDKCRHGNCENKYPKFKDHDCQERPPIYDDDDDDDDKKKRRRHGEEEDGEGGGHDGEDVPLPKECRHRKHHDHHDDDDDKEDEEDRHRGKRNEHNKDHHYEHEEDDYEEKHRKRLCRDWDCMEYVCTNNVTGAHEWLHKERGASCGQEHDKCNRFECDGCGMCVKRHGAPTKCREGHGDDNNGSGTPAWIITVSIVVPLIVLLSLIAIIMVIVNHNRKDGRFLQ